LPVGPVWTADLALLGFGNDDDEWFLPDACEGTFILGATGSGKSTGSARSIALSFLQYGFGGVVLTVKPEERAAWERYAALAGRTGQLCIVEPGGRFRFNFLDYEARRPAVGAGLIENLVSLFYTIMDVHSHGEGDQELQNFWTNTGKQLLRNAFRVLTLATDRLSLESTCRFIAEAPTQLKDADDVHVSHRTFFNTCMKTAWDVARGTPQERVIEEARRYWLNEFPNLAANTRSCVVTAFSAMADGFIEPTIHELFCTDTTLIPEDTLQGAIILIDLSVKRYDAVGVFAQSIWKYLFQKAVERRTDPDDASRRPVFLWIDEAQYFMSAYDGLFQSTARSARCASVYITQNISGLYGAKGGSRSRNKVDGFLGNLNTKIFHCNNDPASNLWAAEQIGKCLTHRFTSSTSDRPSQGAGGGYASERNTTASMQEQIDYAVQPSAFLNLRTGGARFDYLVDAYFVKGGSAFRSGKHFFPTVFRQEFP
jgi:type IV secretory pathway TraG/TraD family ATPase VirD4